MSTCSTRRSRRCGTRPPTLCIISHRYGEVPASADRNPDGLSITELEFNEAQGKPVLLFLMGEHHPVTRKDVEQDPVKLAKLKAFCECAKIWQEGGGVKRVYKEFNSLEKLTRTAGPAIADLKTLLASRQDEPARSRESVPRESGYRWPTQWACGETSTIELGPAPCAACGRGVIGAVVREEIAPGLKLRLGQRRSLCRGSPPPRDMGCCGPCY
jgi:hypothetical protein